MKKVIFIFLFLLTIGSSFAQNWGGGVDDEKYHFGFAFQYIQSEFKILKSSDWRLPFVDPQTGLEVTDPLSSISSVPTAGFGVGFVFNYRINNISDLRITPTLLFNDRILDYKYQYPNIINKEFTSIRKVIESTMAEIPIGIKFKSDRRKNFRAYLLAGGKLSFDLASKKKTDDASKSILYKYVKSQASYFSYEGGVGFDLYFKNFKLSPELKMSYSPNNILIKEQTPFSTPIEKGKLRQFTFSLFIE